MTHAFAADSFMVRCHADEAADGGLEAGTLTLQDDEVDWGGGPQDPALQHALAVIKAKGRCTPHYCNRLACVGAGKHVALRAICNLLLIGWLNHVALKQPLHPLHFERLQSGAVLHCCANIWLHCSCSQSPCKRHT